MANKETNKLRLIAVYNMILRGNRISVRQIQNELDHRFNIQADKKTIYSDIRAIDRFVPIEIIAGRNGGYQKLDVLGMCGDKDRRR